jgi:hypothetical protein
VVSNRYVPVVGRKVKIAGIAGIAGVAAPLLWLIFINFCYVRQFPATATWPPPNPRFVDHAVVYSSYVLWPAAVLFLPPTVPPHPPHEG